MASFKQIPLLVAVLFGFITIGTCKVDVNAEINRLQETLKHMKPAPEIVGGLIQQIQTYCKKDGRIVDANTLNNVSICVEQYLNETQLIDDIKEAVPAGSLDNVFRDTCAKWPKVRICLKEFFSIIEDCWEKGDKVIKAVEESVKFLCGEDNDGARIALFLAEGGLQCLEQHGDSVKKCMTNIKEFQDLPADHNQLNLDLNSTNTADISDEICTTMQQVVHCTEKELRKCNDTTPENVITSMVRFASNSTIGCQLKVGRLQGSKSVTGSGSELSVFSSGFLAIAVVGSIFL